MVAKASINGIFNNNFNCFEYSVFQCNWCLLDLQKCVQGSGADSPLSISNKLILSPVGYH